MKKLTALITAGIMAGVVLVGCGGGESEVSSAAASSAKSETEGTSSAKEDGEKYKVGFSMDFTTNVWRAVMLEKMEKAAEEHSDEIELIVTNANEDSNKQISDVEDLMSQDIDLLIISPYLTEPLTPIIEEVYDKGIPVVVIDHDISSVSDKYTTFIGASNTQIGEKAGEKIVELLNGNGNVVELSGTPGLQATIDRGDVMHSVADKYEGIKFLANVNCEYDQAKAMSNMEDLLQSLEPSEIDLIYTYNDAMALGAVQAIEDAGYGDVGVQILSIDAQKKTMEYIKEGKMIYGTFTYPWPSEKAIEVALDILHGNDVEKYYELESVLITAENVDEYYDPNSDY